MRRIWVPTVIAVAMAVMFWQAPFYETAPVSAATGEMAAFEICAPGWIPESVLFNLNLTPEVYARRFWPKGEVELVWKCENHGGHPLRAECCERAQWSGCRARK